MSLTSPLIDQAFTLKTSSEGVNERNRDLSPTITDFTLPAGDCCPYPSGLSRSNHYLLLCF